MNVKEFEFLGITRFHNAGYKGKNVKIGSKEWIHEENFDNVIHFYQEPTENTHGDKVMDYIQQVAPEATFISVQLYSSAKRVQEEKFIRENIPDIFTTSQFHASADVNETTQALWQYLYNNNCLLCCAAGNENERKTMRLSRNNIYWQTIGACHFNKNKAERADYSNYSCDLDFMSLSNLRSRLFGKVKHTGTSFSSPIFAAMCGLVQDFFIENTGKKLTNANLLQFAIDNCQDLGEQYKDDYYGYGLFILPDPAKIDIARYNRDYKTINLQINNTQAKINDKLVELDSKPTIINNRTMVPVRFIAEAFDCKVDWVPDTQEIIIKK